MLRNLYVPIKIALCTEYILENCSIDQFAISIELIENLANLLQITSNYWFTLKEKSTSTKYTCIYKDIYVFHNKMEQMSWQKRISKIMILVHFTDHARVGAVIRDIYMCIHFLDHNIFDEWSCTSSSMLVDLIEILTTTSTY